MLKRRLFMLVYARFGIVPRQLLRFQPLSVGFLTCTRRWALLQVVFGLMSCPRLTSLLFNQSAFNITTQLE